MDARRRIAQARDMARAVRAGARAHGASPVRVALRARRLRVRGGYEYAEALRQGLLDPRLGADAEARNVSRHRMLEVQHAVNPEALGPLSGEKDAFFRYFTALGIPVPEVYGILGPGVGWRRGGGTLAGADDLAELLGSGLPDELIVKPVEGFQGNGVRLMRRDAIDPGSLLSELRADPAFTDWLIQERLANHPSVAALTSVDTLQTLRVVTLVERSGEVSVLYADFRVALTAGPTDNFRGGRNGNGLSSVRLEDGALGPLRLPRPDASGFTLSRSVPGGATIEGVRLPDWAEALALARAAAIPMLPARTIGWDIALTPGGPVVLEANMFYWPSSAADQGAAARRIVES
jgi:hypothetical protein